MRCDAIHKFVESIQVSKEPNDVDLEKVTNCMECKRKISIKYFSNIITNSLQHSPNFLKSIGRRAQISVHVDHRSI